MSATSIPPFLSAASLVAASAGERLDSRAAALRPPRTGRRVGRSRERRETGRRAGGARRARSRAARRVARRGGAPSLAAPHDRGAVRPPTQYGPRLRDVPAAGPARSRPLVAGRTRRGRLPRRGRLAANLGLRERTLPAAVPFRPHASPADAGAQRRSGDEPPRRRARVRRHAERRARRRRRSRAGLRGLPRPPVRMVQAAPRRRRGPAHGRRTFRTIRARPVVLGPRHGRGDRSRAARSLLPARRRRLRKRPRRVRRWRAAPARRARGHRRRERPALARRRRLSRRPSADRGPALRRGAARLPGTRRGLRRRLASPSPSATAPISTTDHGAAKGSNGHARASQSREDRAAPPPAE